MSAEDSALVHRCRNGDSIAVRELIERFQGDVFGLCVRLLHHRHDAEDVAQEIFFRVFRSLHRWDDSRPLKPWIMTIAVNRCRTLLSQRSKRPISLDYLHDRPSTPERDDGTELIAEIQSAIRHLRPDYRIVFVMFHEQGNSYEEIALAIEKPVGTVKTWLRRARLEVLDALRRRGMLPKDEPLDKPASSIS